MDKYKETYQTWNKVASLYQEKFMDLDLYNETYDFFCNSITGSKASILEIGCGPGNITRYISAKHPGFHIHGIDIAPNMIELARKNNASASFEVMDAREISELQTRFDGIVCGFCLPYLSQADTKKLLSDAYNLLHHNGILYISFVEGDPDNSGFKASSTGDRTYFYYYNLDMLSMILGDQFKKLNVFKVLYEKSESEKEMHTIIILKKING